MPGGPAIAQAPAPRPYVSAPLDSAHGDRPFLYLWPQGAPGAVGGDALDKPKLTPYLPPEGRRNGAAVVVCPGGSYARLSADHEGKRVAEWLNGLGVSAFVLQYRVAPRYRHPAMLQDAQRAIRVVRARAAEWKVDPSRIGILGFSAGGHLASSAATLFASPPANPSEPVDALSARPDFAILCYPVISFRGAHIEGASRDNLLGPGAEAALRETLSTETRVSAATPPTFLWHTSDDRGVGPEHSVLFYEALRRAGVPAELHVFASGPHGLGLAAGSPAASAWPSLAATWMKAIGMMEPQ
jgi:acetyl esterase/lipase